MDVRFHGGTGDCEEYLRVFFANHPLNGIVGSTPTASTFVEDDHGNQSKI